MKIEGKFIFKVAGTLTAISLVVALLLGLTNMLTADKIAAINKQKTEEALAKVVSAADCEFPPMEEIPQAMIDAANEQGGKLSEVYEVQSGGDTIGYAFKVTASGSQGNIVMIVGVDTDLTVTGVSIVKASETAGIGSKVIDNEATSAGTGALDQFVGKSGAGTLVVKQNIDAVTNDEFMRFLCEKGAHFGFYFHYMPVGNEAAPELMPTPEQRKYMIDRIRYLRSSECDIPFYPMDFQNDGEFVGGCIAGGRNYFHINSAGDAEPCVFIHYSNANIHDQSILEILHSPLFMAYHNGQPFNKNHLRPCPMLENPELLEKMVHETGAHSTDLQSPESVEHLCEKCKAYAADWQPTADEVWSHHKIRESRYENYKDWKPSQPLD